MRPPRARDQLSWDRPRRVPLRNSLALSHAVPRRAPDAAEDERGLVMITLVTERGYGRLRLASLRLLGPPICRASSCPLLLPP